MTTIAFIVNGEPHSAMGRRAAAFRERLGSRYRIKVAHRSQRKLLSLARFVAFLARTRPDLIYVFDMSYSGVLASLLYKLAAPARLVIDTGDAIYELARSTGNRGPLGMWLTGRLENVSLNRADRIVVRGTFHQSLLAERGIRSCVIRDGVECDSFAPSNVDDLRKRLGLEGVLTVGLVGSSVWSDALGMCYGWELVETIRLLGDAPVKGIMIGDGSGIAHLKALSKQYGIDDKLLFLGRIPYEELPLYLNLIDVCLSTQTNDVVGRVRTTGKLPIYMAAGRYILASRVGEASLVLGDKMLVNYEGVKDTGYPRRLAEKILELVADPEQVKLGTNNIAVARSEFDYSILAEKMADLFEQLINEGRRPVKGSEEEGRAFTELL